MSRGWGQVTVVGDYLGIIWGLCNSLNLNDLRCTLASWALRLSLVGDWFTAQLEVKALARDLGIAKLTRSWRKSEPPWAERRKRGKRGQESPTPTPKPPWTHNRNAPSTISQSIKKRRYLSQTISINHPETRLKSTPENTSVPLTFFKNKKNRPLSYGEPRLSPGEAWAVPAPLGRRCICWTKWRWTARPAAAILVEESRGRQ